MQNSTMPAVARQELRAESADKFAAAEALGLDASTIAVIFGATDAEAPVVIEAALHELSQEEWGLLVPYLPPERPQTQTMSNRHFIDRVLHTIRSGAPWVAGPSDNEGDAVRKRFARWAHTNIWQTLLDRLRHADLSEKRLAELASVAKRAEQLRSRTARQSVRPTEPRWTA
jgi:transposase